MHYILTREADQVVQLSLTEASSKTKIVDKHQISADFLQDKVDDGDNIEQVKEVILSLFAKSDEARSINTENWKT